MTYHYQNIAMLLEAQIADGVYRVGDRLPSVREASRNLGVSMTTIYNAYNMLESQGLIRAKPQSDYFVARADPTKSIGPTPAGIAEAPALDLEAIARHVLGSAKHDDAIPFGSAYVDAKLLPVSRLLTLMREVSRRPENRRTRANDAAGLADLRREIAKRYLHHGYSVPVEEIIITSGTMDGLNLVLSALLRPGDAVAVEDPCFFASSTFRVDLGVS